MQWLKNIFKSETKEEKQSRLISEVDKKINKLKNDFKIVHSYYKDLNAILDRDSKFYEILKKTEDSISDENNKQDAIFTIYEIFNKIKPHERDVFTQLLDEYVVPVAKQNMPLEEKKDLIMSIVDMMAKCNKGYKDVDSEAMMETITKLIKPCITPIATSNMDVENKKNLIQDIFLKLTDMTPDKRNNIIKIIQPYITTVMTDSDTEQEVKVSAINALIDTIATLSKDNVYTIASNGYIDKIERIIYFHNTQNATNHEDDMFFDAHEDEASKNQSMTNITLLRKIYIAHLKQQSNTKNTQPLAPDDKTIQQYSDLQFSPSNLSHIESPILDKNTRNEVVLPELKKEIKKQQVNVDNIKSQMMETLHKVEELKLETMYIQHPELKKQIEQLAKQYSPLDIFKVVILQGISDTSFTAEPCNFDKIRVTSLANILADKIIKNQKIDIANLKIVVPETFMSTTKKLQHHFDLYLIHSQRSPLNNEQEFKPDIINKQDMTVVCDDNSWLDYGNLHSKVMEVLSDNMSHKGNKINFFSRSKGSAQSVQILSTMLAKGFLKDKEVKFTFSCIPKKTFQKGISGKNTTESMEQLINEINKESNRNNLPKCINFSIQPAMSGDTIHLTKTAAEYAEICSCMDSVKEALDLKQRTSNLVNPANINNVYQRNTQICS